MKLDYTFIFVKWLFQSVLQSWHSERIKKRLSIRRHAEQPSYAHWFYNSLKVCHMNRPLGRILLNTFRAMQCTYSLLYFTEQLIPELTILIGAWYWLSTEVSFWSYSAFNLFISFFKCSLLDCSSSNIRFITASWASYSSLIRADSSASFAWASRSTTGRVCPGTSAALPR